MRGSRALSVLIVLLVVLTSCTVQRRPDYSSLAPKTPFKPPPAVAPPNPGVDPPDIRLLDPGTVPLALADRPQRQLTAWADSMSARLDIPRAALEAYGYAAGALRRSSPKCGMPWTMLAGIGEVESDHGRYGGASLDETGTPSIPIRGMPLSGDDGTKRIEGTGPDGDAQYVQALGPFQFLPSTWNVWGRDADGDGQADPDNIYDAALAAGTYLCSVAGDVQTPDHFWRAVFTYNESHDYGQDVLDYAAYYGSTSFTLVAPSTIASRPRSGP